MNKKYFTIQEANEILPAVREELVHLQQLDREFQNTYHHLQAYKKNGLHEERQNKERIFLLEAAIDFLEMQAESSVEQLEKRSIYVKSIEQGLVDFPAKVNGKPVLLCWKQGEEFISHYHDWFGSYAERRKIYATDDE